jgi:hypothetical protein
MAEYLARWMENGPGCCPDVRGNTGAKRVARLYPIASSRCLARSNCNEKPVCRGYDPEKGRLPTSRPFPRGRLPDVKGPLGWPSGRQLLHFPLPRVGWQCLAMQSHSWLCTAQHCFLLVGYSRNRHPANTLALTQLSQRVLPAMKRYVSLAVWQGSRRPISQPSVRCFRAEPGFPYAESGPMRSGQVRAVIHRSAACGFARRLEHAGGGCRQARESGGHPDNASPPRHDAAGRISYRRAAGLGPAVYRGTADTTVPERSSTCSHALPGVCQRRAR